ncbi:MAG: sugar phosphate isomerase/epimerase [Anaerolineae bacterium]|nr:sugar phosphate isomerase/epimerase [Anaerolineae bacterium]
MRLGGPVFGNFSDPEDWIANVKARGYRAAYCPVQIGCDSDTIRAYADAAAAADIIIAEVGAWSNPISPSETQRQEALTKCKDALALADEIGALCCVNIAGSCNPDHWDGPHADNLSEATFDLIVETVREIIDAVKPTRTYYTLETMPWIFPDSVASYERLIEVIDRERFSVHLDPVNIINSPALYFNNGALIRECFAKLGSHIKSCHIKDIVLHDNLTVHLDEVRPGLGTLDYRTLLHEASRFDVPLMLEHLPHEEDYIQAAAYVRSVAAAENLVL